MRSTFEREETPDQLKNQSAFAEARQAENSE